MKTRKISHSSKNEDFIQLNYDERLRAIWKYTQRGLVYPAPHAIFSTIQLNGEVSRLELAELMAKTRGLIHKEPHLKDGHSTVIIGVSFPRWQKICQTENLTLPKGMSLNLPNPESPEESRVFKQSTGSFTNSNDDLWFHIKSDSAAACDALLHFIMQEFQEKIASIESQAAASKIRIR